MSLPLVRFRQRTASRPRRRLPDAHQAALLLCAAAALALLASRAAAQELEHTALGGDVFPARVAGGPVNGTPSRVRTFAPPAHAARHLAALPSRAVPDARLRTLARESRRPVRFCYEEFGLKVNPWLAGTLVLRVTVAADGSVTHADVADRSWFGAGSAEAEQCILARVSHWRVPAAASASRYSLRYRLGR